MDFLDTSSVKLQILLRSDAHSWCLHSKDGIYIYLNMLYFLKVGFWNSIPFVINMEMVLLFSDTVLC